MSTTATILRGKLRDYLDDPDEGDNSQGQYWSDTQLNEVLDQAQWSVYRWLVSRKQVNMLQRMLKNVSGTSNVSLPVDYAFSVSAEIDADDGVGTEYRPASLYMGWSNRDYLFNVHTYMVAVAGTTVEFRKGGVTASVDGRLWYYKKPTTITGTATLADFDDQVYDTILFLAAAILQMKDVGTVSRSMKRFQSSLAALTSIASGNFPNLDSNTQP